MKHHVLWGLLATLAGTGSAHSQQADGERLFRQRCASCHTVEPGRNRVGPSLADLDGRKAGTVEGARYSDAMKASDLVWNRETLDRFLGNPREVVPGTTMSLRITNEAQRTALVDYLAGTDE